MGLSVVPEAQWDGYEADMNTLSEGENEVIGDIAVDYSEMNTRINDMRQEEAADGDGDPDAILANFF